LSRNKTIAPNLFCMARTACDWSLYFTISLMVNLGFHWAWVYHLVRTSRQTVDIKATPSVPLWKLGFHWAWEVKHFLFWPKYIKRLLILLYIISIIRLIVEHIFIISIRRYKCCYFLRT
jgi:hypothetical protein